MSISFFLSSSATYSERLLPLSTPLSALKGRIETITGIPADAQRLSVYRSAEEWEVEARRRKERAAGGGGGGGTNEGVMSVRSGIDEGMTLGSLGVGEFGVLRVDDSRSSASATTSAPDPDLDLAPSQRFELSQEAYEARPDTVLAQLKARKMGRFAEGVAEEPGGAGEEGVERVPPEVVVGARCLVLPPSGAAAVPGAKTNNPFSLMPVLSLGNPSPVTATPAPREEDALERRGTIRFVGPTEFGEIKTQGRSVWVGVELDEPVGRNDGSVAGKRYFSARSSHGVFVRLDRVRVGDYPELEVGIGDEEDDFEGLDEI